MIEGLPKMAVTRRGVVLRSTVLGLVVLPLLLVGYAAVSDPEPRTNPRPMNSTSVSSGKAVFFEYCAGCHGRRADGRGLQALNLDPKPQNLRNAEFVSYLTDERAFGSISGGVRGTSMPPFELILTEEKRWDVLNYIRSLTTGDATGLPNAPAHQEVVADLENPAPRTEEAVAAGRRLYLNYCASCHGAQADGKGVIAPNLTPAPRNLVVVTSFGEKPFIDYLSDARIYDSVTNGVPGTSMQPWIGVLSDEERWQIIGFMRSEANEQREKAP